MSKNNFVPYLIIGLFFVITLIINLIICYPANNDLDEIGWLVDNLSFSRLESFANANYPFGLPVLLWLLTPIFGSFLRAALICEAVAAAVIMLFAYLISIKLFRDKNIAILTLVLVAVLVFKTATSEFADGIATAFLLAGIYFILSSDTRKAYLTSGLLVGAAYIFRYHYLAFLIIIPIAILVLSGLIRNKFLNILFFVSGFIISSLPLLVINSIVYKNPFSSGFSQYIIGISVMHSLNWNDFPNTYNAWPLSKLIIEQPKALAVHMISNVRIILKYIISGLIAVPLLISQHKKNRAILFIMATSVLYTVFVILPTIHTDRAFLPVAVILAILIVSLLAFVKSRWFQIIGLCILIILIGNLPANFEHITYKQRAQSWNHVILRELKSAGMKHSSEVFSNIWHVYPLDDPKFITFYNYGGWLLLDDKYTAERPIPTATTIEEWEQFMLSHKLKYMIIQKSSEVEALFTDKLPVEFERIYLDSEYLILTLRS